MLEILEDAGFHTLPCGQRHLLAKCKCSCGTIFITRKQRAMSGSTKSCGCIKGRPNAHGLGKHKLYGTWHQMMQRCYRKSHVAYKNYGGRGIRVAKQWHNVSTFIEDIIRIIGDRPEGMTLERKDNNRDYCPSNVKWATKSEQGSNKRTNHVLTINGTSKCIKSWSEETGISIRTILSRIRYGKTGNELIAPVKESKR